MTPKFSFQFWRIKWNFFNSFKIIQVWGLNIQITCLLCGEEEKTISQIYFNCPYSRTLLSATEALISAIWRTQNTPIHSLSVGDIRIGDIMEVMDKFAYHRTPFWGGH